MEFCKTSFPGSNVKSFISNDLHRLSSHLLQALFPGKSPSEEGLLPSFGRKIIVIPSNRTKEFLTQELLKERSCLLGIRFLSLAQALDLFTKLCQTKRPVFPSHLPFMFYLEHLIRDLAQSDDERLTPLKQYVAEGEQKVLDLSTELSHVFLHYTIYGDQALAEWQNENGWQQVLWERVQKDWDLPHLIFQKTREPRMNLECHFFHISHIPKLLRETIERLSSHWKVHYYFLSPSPFFWSDFLSTKEQAKLDKLFQKQGVANYERENFREIMRENHRLLSNWGKVGAPLFEYLSNQNLCLEDFNEPTKKKTLLQTVQSNFFYLENTAHAEKDDSISIHEVHSKLQEVELLYQHLHEIFAKDPNASGNDITVLVPDSKTYHPYIQYVFGSESSPFGFRISDLSITAESPFMMAALLLFEVLESRFEPDILCQLFTCQAFAEKCDIGKEHVQILKSIIENHHIRWGFDSSMKSEILGEADLSSIGSWKHAFENILAKLPFLSCPYSFSSYETLGEVISNIENLYKWRRKIKRAKWPLKLWISEIQSLIEEFLAPWEDSNLFFKELFRLSPLAKQLDSNFSYQSFRRALTEIFLGNGESEMQKGKQTIEFLSLSDASITPTNYIFLLGLDEEAFPRRATYRSLNEMYKRKGSDIQPKLGEKDRYTLFQSLLLAKKSLVISYVGVSESDGRALYPSILLSELCDYLKLDLIQKHPCLSFNHAYFSKENYLQERYRLACKHYQKTASTQKHFATVATKPPPEKWIINLKDLSHLTRNPIQLYCNQSLGIFLEKENPKQKRLFSEFFLSYFDKAIFKQELLKKREIDIAALPTALFQEAALQEIEEEIDNLKEGLHFFGLSSDEIFSIDFSYADDDNEGSNVCYPPISFSLSNQVSGEIVGEVDWVSNKGLISTKKFNIGQLWKLLPRLIALAYTDLPTSALFLEDGQEKSFSRETLKALLPSLITYYQKALEKPSPLLPDWIEGYTKDQTETLQNIIAKRPLRFDDPYVTFSPPNPDESWKTFAEPLCKILTV